MLNKISCFTVISLLYAGLLFGQEIKERNFIFPDPSDVREYTFPIDEFNVVSSEDTFNWGGAVYEEKTNKLYSIDFITKKGVVVDLNTQEVFQFGKGEGRGPEEISQISGLQIFEKYIALSDIGSMRIHIYDKETLAFVTTVTNKKISPYIEIINDTIITANPIHNPFFNTLDLGGNILKSYGSIYHLSNAVLEFTGILSNYNSTEYYLNYFPAYLKYSNGKNELELHELPSSIDYGVKKLSDPNFKSSMYGAPNDRLFHLLYHDKEIKALIHGIFEDNYAKVSYYLDIYNTNDEYLLSFDYYKLNNFFKEDADKRSQKILDKSVKSRTPHAFYVETPSSKIRIINLVDVAKRYISNEDN